MMLYHGIYQSNKDKENHWKAYNEQMADTYVKWEKMNKKLEELEKKGAKQHMPEAYSIAAHMKDDFSTIVKSMEKDIGDYQDFQNNTIEFNVNLIKDLEKELRRHRAEIIKKQS